MRKQMFETTYMIKIARPADEKSSTRVFGGGDVREMERTAREEYAKLCVENPKASIALYQVTQTLIDGRQVGDTLLV